MKIGYAITGSFCTVSKSIDQLRRLSEENDVIPILSEKIQKTDTRFGAASQTLEAVEEICRRKALKSIVECERLGPDEPLDVLIICPCTGNTLAKLSQGITDGAVLMAAKAHLRCDRPLVIALATNDALSQNLQNVSTLLSRKNVYFVPFFQDDPINKPHSLVCDFQSLDLTLSQAMHGKQLQPLFLCK